MLVFVKLKLKFFPRYSCLKDETKILAFNISICRKKRCQPLINVTDDTDDKSLDTSGDSVAAYK